MKVKANNYVTVHDVSELNLFDMHPLPSVDSRPAVWVLGWTWYDARALAQCYYQLGYDQIGGGTHGKDTPIRKGEVLLVPDAAGHLETFAATRDTNGESFGREDDAWERVEMALEGGRPIEEVLGGVQDDGEEELFSEERDSSYASASCDESGEDILATGGVFGDRENPSGVRGTTLGRLLGVVRAGVREWRNR